MAKRETKSPYQRHGKKPFVYSDTLKQLEMALRVGGGSVYDLARRHNEYCARLFGAMPGTFIRRRSSEEWEEAV